MTADLRTISELAPLLRAGEVSPVSLVAACLAQIDARPGVNAYISVRREQAVEEAIRAEAEIRAGTYRGPLHGVPVAVKDLIDVAGTATTSASALPCVAAAHDAAVVQRLRQAGAIIIGKTNLHEFAFGTTSEESAFGPVRNPLDETRSAGGSSGGSAAALAAGMAFGALGTDTGGSIRIPSAACGTVGLKPTLGEITTAGVVPLSGTFDHVGPMARSVADVAMMHALLGGLVETLARGPAGAPGALVFGVPRAYLCDRLDAGTAEMLGRAVDTLAAADHHVVDVAIEHAEWTPHVYLHIVLAEAAWYHAAMLEQHAGRYSPGVRARLEMGGYVLAEDYVRAMRLREVLMQEVDRALDHCDALLLPTLPIGAPPLGAATVMVGAASEPVRAAMLRLTQLFNVTGHPAIALPAGTGSDGLPRSLQLVGRRGHTGRLLHIAARAERYISGGLGSVGGGTG